MIPDRREGDEHWFKLLKPIYGEVMDALWRRYQSMKPERKERMLRKIKARAMRVLDMRLAADQKLYLDPPRPAVIGGGPYHVGNVTYPGTAPYPFTLYSHELIQHLFVLGPSGTGKTTFLLGLLRQLLRDGIVLWALDWKRNYRVLLRDEHGKEVLVLTIGGDIAPLRLNMLQPPAGVAVEEWVEALGDVISSGYLLMEGARSVLTEGMLEALQAQGERATFRDALPFIRAKFAQAKQRKVGWLESTERAVNQLTKGPFGDALNAREDVMTIAELLQRSVVFELEGLGDNQRKTFSVYLLQAILLTRKKQSLPKEVLHQVLLFDEAQNVFTREQLGDPPSVQGRLAREVREFGTGMLAATQETSTISSSIIANTATKIVLHTTYGPDVRMASDFLGVKPEDLGKIPMGHGIARLRERHQQSFLFRFEQQPIKNLYVTDDEVRRRYQAWRQTAPAPVLQNGPGSREVLLLLDIAAFPISKVTERYERLRWNPNTGTIAQQSILEKGLAEFLFVEDGRTRLKLLSLTPVGVEIVQAHGGIVRPTGAAGAEHELWRSRLRDRCEQHSYTVTEEFHLGERKRVDLVAVRGSTRYFIEVETGKSDVQENVRKCAGHAPLIVFFTNKTAFAAAQALIPKNVTVLMPENINRIHEILN